MKSKAPIAAPRLDGVQKRRRQEVQGDKSDEASLNIRISDALHRQLNEIAKQTGTSMSVLGREGFRLVIQKFQEEGRLVIGVQKAA